MFFRTFIIKIINNMLINRLKELGKLFGEFDSTISCHQVHGRGRSYSMNLNRLVDFHNSINFVKGVRSQLR